MTTPSNPQTLATHFPNHIDAKVDAEIRQRFNIRLPKEAMQAKGRRW